MSILYYGVCIFVLALLIVDAYNLRAIHKRLCTLQSVVILMDARITQLESHTENFPAENAKEGLL